MGLIEGEISSASRFLELLIYDLREGSMA